MTGRRGFTLVELLVTASLLAVVAGGLYGTYAIGLRTWVRTQDTLTTLPRLTLGLERVAAQLRSSLMLPETPWVGGDGRLAFVTARRGLDPVRVLYQRTPAGCVIEQTVSLMDHQQSTHQWLEHVRAFTVTYAYVTEEGTVAWEPAWADPEHLPRLVRLTVTTATPSTPARTLTKTVWIPTGVLGTYERGRGA